MEYQFRKEQGNCVTNGDKGTRYPIKDSDVFQGYDKVICPIARCPFTREFMATTISLKDAEGTLKRRQEFLRRGHLAGQHRRRR
jgi:hypothetical protein